MLVEYYSTYRNARKLPFLAGQSAPQRRASRGGWLLAPAMAWLFLFTIVPVAMMLVLSFWTSTAYGIKAEFTLDNYRTIFGEPVYLSTFARTLRIAAVTTALTLVVAYPVALIVSRARGGWKAIALLFIFLPFWTSYVVRSFLWLPMLGRNGLINFLLIKLGIVTRPVDWLIYNEGAVYVGLVYAYMLFMFLPIYQSLDKQDRKLEEAASDLGATPARTFWRVILPLSLPGVFSGCTMVFMFACGAYVTPQLLGGASSLMASNVIGSQFQISNNWALGSALSITLMVIVLFCFMLGSSRLGLLQVLSGSRR